ncbi:MAG: NAD-dependent epimerase/dehydratase family protein [Caenibius sp.]
MPRSHALLKRMVSILPFRWRIDTAMAQHHALAAIAAWRSSAIARKLARQRQAITPHMHGELDLTDQAAVRSFMQDARPDAVVLAAAKVEAAAAQTTLIRRNSFMKIWLWNATSFIKRSWPGCASFHADHDNAFTRMAQQPMREGAC